MEEKQIFRLTTEEAAFHITAAKERLTKLNEKLSDIMKDIINEQRLIDALSIDIQYQTMYENLSQSLRSDTVLTKKANGYDPKDTWFNKAKFILSRRGELLTANEMVGLISDGYEPRLKNISAEELAKIKSNLAGQLKMGLDKTFKRMKISGEPNFYYGLISWFNGEDCKPEYLPGPEIDNSIDDLL